MYDIDTLLADLQPARTPPPHPPAIVVPLWRRPALLTGAAAAAVLLLVVGALPADSSSSYTTRSGEGAPITVTDAELRLAIQRGGVAHRLADGDTCVRGERVYFQVSVAAPETLRLSLRHSGGTEQIVERLVEPGGQMLQTGDHLIGFEFDTVGPHTFYLQNVEGEIVETVQIEVLR